MWFTVLPVASGAELSGQWALVESPAQAREAIADAADASVAGLPALYRSRAKDRLVDKAKVCTTYAVRVDADVIAWACDGGAELVVPRDKLGTPLPMRFEGQKLTTTVQLDGDIVKARFEGTNGARTVRFQQVGDTLRVESALHGDKLSTPLTWTTTYAAK